MPRGPNLQQRQDFLLPPRPRWVRADQSRTDLAEAAFRTGAALALLDARVHAAAPFAGVWRRRLALKAAVASARIIRRSEDEQKLRDAFYLRRPADDPGPAGRLFAAWLTLCDHSAPLAGDVVLHVAETLQLPRDEALFRAIAQNLANSEHGAPFAAARTATAVLAHCPDAEVFSLWLADAVLAHRLKWPRPVPLLATALLHPAVRVHERRPHPADQTSWLLSCLRAYDRGAQQACDLFSELSRRSQKLLSVAPRLRAKGAGAVIDLLHHDDAVPASARIKTLSDRGLRRLFDRLVTLGAVQELSERATFRLYGL
jgi:Protein of unknown function (DUF1403)